MDITEEISKNLSKIIGTRSMAEKFRQMQSTTADPMEAMEKLDDAVEIGSASFKKITRSFLDLLKLPKTTKTVVRELQNELRVLTGEFREERNKLRSSILSEINSRKIGSEEIKKQAYSFQLAKNKLNIFYEGLDEVLDIKKKILAIPKLIESQQQKKQYLSDRMISITGKDAESKKDRKELQRKIETIDETILEYQRKYEVETEKLNETLTDFGNMVSDLNGSLDSVIESISDEDIKTVLRQFKTELTGAVDFIRKSNSIEEIFGDNGALGKIKMFNVVVADAASTIKKAAEAHSAEFKKNSDKMVAGLTSILLALGKTVEMFGSQSLQKMGAGVGGDITDSYFTQAFLLGTGVDELLAAVKDNSASFRVFAGQDIGEILNDNSAMQALKDGGRVIGKVGAEAIAAQLKNIDSTLSIGAFQPLQTPEQRGQSAGEMSKLFRASASRMNENIDVFIGDFYSDMESGVFDPMIQEMRRQGLSGDKLVEALINNYTQTKIAAKELGLNTQTHKAFLQQSLNARHQGIAEAIKGQVSVDMMLAQYQNMGVKFTEQEREIAKRYVSGTLAPDKIGEAVKIAQKIQAADIKIQSKAQAASSNAESFEIMMPKFMTNTLMGALPNSLMDLARNDNLNTIRAESIAAATQATGQSPVTTSDQSIINLATEIDAVSGSLITLRELVTGAFKNPLIGVFTGLTTLAAHSLATAIAIRTLGMSAGGSGLMGMFGKLSKSKFGKVGLIAGGATLLGGLAYSGFTGASTREQTDLLTKVQNNAATPEEQVKLQSMMYAAPISQEATQLFNQSYIQQLQGDMVTSSSITETQNNLATASDVGLWASIAAGLWSSKNKSPVPTSMLGKAGSFVKSSVPVYLATSGFQTAYDVVQKDTRTIANELGISYSPNQQGSGLLNMFLGAEADDSLAMQTYKDVMIRTIGAFDSLAENLTFGLFESDETPQIKTVIDEMEKKSENESEGSDYMKEFTEAIPPQKLAEILVNLEQHMLKLSTTSEHSLQQEKVAELKKEGRNALEQQVYNSLNEANLQNKLGNIEKRVQAARINSGYS